MRVSLAPVSTRTDRASSSGGATDWAASFDEAPADGSGDAAATFAADFGGTPVPQGASADADDDFGEFSSGDPSLPLDDSAGEIDAAVAQRVAAVSLVTLRAAAALTCRTLLPRRAAAAAAAPTTTTTLATLARRPRQPPRRHPLLRTNRSR